jgi:hypothetical protein
MARARVVRCALRTCLLTMGASAFKTTPTPRVFFVACAYRAASPAPLTPRDALARVAQHRPHQARVNASWSKRELFLFRLCRHGDLTAGSKTLHKATMARHLNRKRHHTVLRRCGRRFVEPEPLRQQSMARPWAACLGCATHALYKRVVCASVVVQVWGGGGGGGGVGVED